MLPGPVTNRTVCCTVRPLDRYEFGRLRQKSSHYVSSRSYPPRHQRAKQVGLALFRNLEYREHTRTVSAISCFSSRFGREGQCFNLLRHQSVLQEHLWSILALYVLCGSHLLAQYIVWAWIRSSVFLLFVLMRWLVALCPSVTPLHLHLLHLPFVGRSSTT